MSGIIGINLQPAQPEPASRPKAVLQALPQAQAQMKALPAKVDSAWRLVTRYRNTTNELDLKKDPYKGIEAKALDDIWKGIKEHLGEGAHQIRIDLSNLTVRYRDKTDTVQYLDLSAQDPSKPIDAKLIELIQKVRNTAKKLWVDMKFGHQFDNDAARSVNGAKPFVIPTEQWKKAIPKSPSDFLEAGHFADLQNLLKNKPESCQEALSSILAAEAFIQKMKDEAREKKDQMANTIQGDAFQKLPIAEQKQLRKSFGEIEHFEKELETIDRFAIYWAVGVWGHTDANQATPQERFEKAKLISEGVEASLSKKLKPSEDYRDGKWYPTKLMKQFSIGEAKAESLLGLGPFIATYAADAGDLAASTKLERMRRVEEDGNRESGGPSLVDFIAHGVMHLKDPSVNLEANLGALNLGYDSQTIELLAKSAVLAKSKAEQIRDQQPPPIIGDGKDNLERLKHNDLFKTLVGK